MAGNNFRKIWSIPFALAAVTAFGLLAALLGTGLWHVLSWATLSIPLFVLVWHLLRRHD